MESQPLFLIAADAVMAVHFLFVVFVIGSVVAVVVGKLKSWSWTRNPWFRLGHLASIVFVVVQAWLGKVCFLTTWEMALRARAGDATYTGEFIAHWVESILYYRAPLWVFATAYTIFATIVIVTWVWAPPRAFRDRLVIDTSLRDR